MRLNWFSPLPPAATGIAEYTGTVLPWLAAKAEVTLWTDQSEWEPRLETHAAVRRYSPDQVPWDDLNLADLTYFHFGNNPDFHHAIWSVSQRHSGIAVLHDLRLQDLFWGIFVRRSNQPAEYIQLMQQIYGTQGGNVAAAVVAGTQHLASTYLAYPLTEAAIQNALGVVVHTPGGFESIEKHCRPALAELRFPYAAADECKLNEWTKIRRKAVRPPFKLVVIGYINPNRRLESILQALAGIHDRQKFHLHVYGPVWHEKQIEEKARGLGVHQLLRLHGYTPACELDAAIADADLAINLRFPTMGEASMSQLQIWDHALPSLVTRTGWYASLPENTVRFVNQDSEIEDLGRHLRDFGADPAAFAALGENGRATLVADYQPTNYVEDLLRFSHQAANFRPLVALSKTAQASGDSLRPWIASQVLDQTAQRLAKRLLEFVPADRKK